MKKILAAVTAVASMVAVPVGAWACGAQDHMASVQEPAVYVQQVDVKQVVQLQKQAAVHVFDANGEKTRNQLGVIPGATMLTSATSYDVAKELPPVKEANLVFYCYSEKCSASTIAAERAAKAGYTHVSVMSVGITGWKAAGQKTARPKTNTI